MRAMRVLLFTEWLLSEPGKGGEGGQIRVTYTNAILPWGAWRFKIAGAGRCSMGFSPKR